ncbi:polymer-forming cytoskeletal protein [Pedobacter sp. KR3-3]|uniref:Polymer-forming cytoskeletal protein n=1 Tax=Pedobacter albus TaxID=3113905 RepID=A0ABU7I9M9_9SPHI|nr:polymer-forming cytoskeletal protein [Pedobacter sp. KR3-3]MEE1945909.1 polymer-forming cytoskeletal protein [Pedobacter sp. KR3-3]
MLKAGALYFAIVIAFFIAIVSASLIMLAAHYRNSYLKEIRYTRLLNNLNSGVEYALANKDAAEGKQTLDLFGDELDSLELDRKNWGIFDLAILKSFVKQDTLKRAFLIGNLTDSTALYLSDEDRPLSISGHTRITGNVELPKSGIRQSYAEGKPYDGGKELIFAGKIGNSTRTLKALNEKLLERLKQVLANQDRKLPLLQQNELKVSFLDSTRKFQLPQIANLADVKLEGNIILVSDSLVTISATAQLNGIQVYAPLIKVEEGFKGNCQLFAIDSILVANNVEFKYPSVLGVMRTKKSVVQPQIVLGDHVNFDGIIFSHEKERTALQTLIGLGKDTRVQGEIYSTGLLRVEKGSKVNGKVSCNRFLMKTPLTLYENFLIDVAFNRKARSRYYLSAKLFNAQQPNQILKWLN